MFKIIAGLLAALAVLISLFFFLSDKLKSPPTLPPTSIVGHQGRLPSPPSFGEGAANGEKPATESSRTFKESGTLPENTRGSLLGGQPDQMRAPLTASTPPPSPAKQEEAVRPRPDAPQKSPATKAEAPSPTPAQEAAAVDPAPSSPPRQAEPKEPAPTAPTAGVPERQTNAFLSPFGNPIQETKEKTASKHAQTPLSLEKKGAFGQLHAKAPEQAQKDKGTPAKKRTQASSATQSGQITVFSRSNGATVRLNAEASLLYKKLVLSKPDRVVIDLSGPWSIKPQGIPKNPLVTNVRLGRFPQKTRIVIDLSHTPRQTKLLLSKDKRRLDVRVDR